TALTKTGMIMGTPSYMAPEQARGERVDHRADIYAVGAILYCAVTGNRPFDRGDPTATLTAVLTEDPPRPRSIEATIPEALELIIRRAMAKIPSARYQSMADLDHDLEPFDMEGAAPILQRPTSGATLASNAVGTQRIATTAGHKQAREVAMVRPMILL